MARARPALVLAAVVGLHALTLTPSSARAQGGAAAAPTTPATATTTVDADSAAKAQQHFQRARELYASGAYREAITELEAAHTLDPTAKDLVYNLALVNEKLGKIDDALRWMQTYRGMELDAQERGRAEAAVRRLEGAKREIAAQKTPATPPPASAPPPDGTQEHPEHGRIDALTIASAALAVGGLAVGAIFGVMAVSEKPSSSFVTGRDGSYDDLLSKASTAHNHARVADIGLVVGVVFSVATAVLYFGRAKSPSRTARPPQQRAFGLGGVF